MPERFDMHRMVEGGRARVTVTGEVDLFTAPEFKAALRDLIATDGITDLTIDLTASTFLDSAGIAALFGAYRRLRARGGELTVLADDPRIVEPLKLTGLTDFVSVVGAA